MRKFGMYGCHWNARNSFITQVTNKQSMIYIVNTVSINLVAGQYYSSSSDPNNSSITPLSKTLVVRR